MKNCKELRIAEASDIHLERYVDEVYRHMWAEPKKLDDPAVLRAALLESDLPADRLFELVQTAPVKEALMAETQRAVDRGTFGSPTFFVDDDIYFWRQWEKAGKTLYNANRVVVGHLELMIKWPGRDLNTFHQRVADFWRDGPPKGTWR